MSKRFASAAVAALLLTVSGAWADEPADKVDDNAGFGIATSDARGGGADRLAQAGDALVLAGGANTDPAEATIALIADADAQDPVAVTADIPAPEDPPPEAGFGANTAADARDGGVDGLAIAEEALGRAEAIIEEALDDRGIPVRSDDVPDVPGAPDIPEVPGVPEVPAPPTP